MTTLPLELVSFLGFSARWPGEPKRAKISACPVSDRPIEKPIKRLSAATKQHSYKPRGNFAEQMKYCGAILKELLVSELAWPFGEPVDAQLLGWRDYHEIIKHPMDMGTVEQKMDNREYDSPDAFAEDMRLIFTNCYRHNPAEHEVVDMAHKIETLLELRYAKRWPMSPRRKSGCRRRGQKMLTRTVAGPRSPNRVTVRLVTRTTGERNSRRSCSNCTSDSASCRR
ncbi:hypothetical protein HPB48_015302 [Haemaphysalis longicornis]|uniref:Bromo domain-containing protein n=1 Tax=Haemaphysalis longicornis TaxID=44386 RepID=A0A9J6GK81_HAELO|nr:hypothetical protein HPB48_015302 [Haemaphysalis longicornis]